ncbi:MAG TPA: hypothetical protein VK484_14045 [Ferruginibacter sp.]|nr:hypothetical protein [Ferruginibacter sp.]
MLRQNLDYLHENPVRAGIVYEPQDQVYSSGIDIILIVKARLGLSICSAEAGRRPVVLLRHK